MAPLAVDPAALDSAGGAVVAAGAGLGAVISSLTAALAGCAGMAGDDPAGAVFGRSYDGSAAALVQAMSVARNGLCNLGDGVRMSAHNYSLAEAMSDVAGRAAPYVGWLSAAAGQAELSAGQATAAATAFEAALAATVHPAAVTANRVLLGALVATNILGQNTPAIAATEFDYVEMWAQDVGAMVGYHAGAAAVAETLTPFSVPPLDLAGLASQAGAQLTGMATSVSAALSPIAEGAVEGVPAVVAAAQSVAAGLPVDAALQVGQAAAYPASMLIGPMMQLAQMGTTANTAGLAGAEAAGLAAADVPTFAGDIASGTGLGGAGGLGAGMSAELGKARLVGAMSVPPTWEGSVPARMASSAMAGLGAMPAEVPAAGGPMGMMPMPMGMGGAGAGMPAGMMGRGGANPHVVQARPSVVPRVGIG